MCCTFWFRSIIALIVHACFCGWSRWFDDDGKQYSFTQKNTTTQRKTGPRFDGVELVFETESAWCFLRPFSRFLFVFRSSSSSSSDRTKVLLTFDEDTRNTNSLSSLLPVLFFFFLNFFLSLVAFVSPPPPPTTKKKRGKKRVQKKEKKRKEDAL